MNAESAAMDEAPVSERALTWAERNQQWLVRQLARLTERVQKRYSSAADGSSAPLPEARAATTDTERNLPPFVPALERVAALFGLSRFEREVLLLVAGVELDGTLRRAVVEATGGSGRPTFGLALDVLNDAHWDAISMLAPLRYWRLISLEAGMGLTEAGLRIDERVLHELTGVAALDERLQGVAWAARSMQVGEAMDPAFARRLARALDEEVPQPVLLVITPPEWELPHQGGEALVVSALAREGLNSIFTHARDWAFDPREFSETARVLDREAALTSSVVFVRFETVSEHTHEHEMRAASLISQLRSHVALIGRPSRELLAKAQQRRIHHLTAPRLPASPACTTMPTALDRALDRASQQFQLAREQVDSALASVELPAASDADAAARTDAVVWHALREASRGGLETLAQRIESRIAFADVVLPAPQLAMLHDITCQLRHRDRVYRQWGFAAASSRGLGLAALFTGESGTGKTMAAEAIANEAQLDLYRIDLASVVSKYIGETEKNLKRLFDTAESSGAVLLFDEADALFGKRSEVRDSHDRYANIEIAYLLQRIDAYRGLAILTTNMKSTLDRAFLRRIRFVVQFPFPDAHARENIWRRQFPAAAPLGDIDFAALARLQMTGGNIRSIAVNAAFKAAELRRPIYQGLLLAAAQAEYAKLERNPSDLVGAL